MTASKNKRKKTVKSGKKYKSGTTEEKRSYVKRRTEVYGVLIITLAVLLFISVFGLSDYGVVNEKINNFLSYIFGAGKYLIPFLLVIWGFSFFFERIRFLSSSFGWGFLLLFLSILGIISNNLKYVNIFDEVLIKARGGIIGAWIFYGLSRLFSSAGAIALLVVLIIISLLIITKISLIEAGKKVINFFKNLKVKSRIASLKEKDFPEEGKTPDRIGISKDKVYNSGKSEDFREIEIIDHIAKGSKDKSEVSDKHIRKYDMAGAVEGRLEEEQLKGQLKIPIVKSGETENNYRFPPINLLKKSRNIQSHLYKESVKERVHTLQRLLSDFNVDARIERVVSGPTVTLYELKLLPGVKVQRLLSLEDDFCVALGSPDIRILAPIPGKSAIGIEVPNTVRSIVTLGDIFSGDDRNLMDNLLNVPLGKNLSGNIVYMDIAKMPHVLIAGATNSGKSSCLNSIIISLLMKVKPSDVRFVMIDPKMVELSIYNGIPHLLSPVVINPKKASSVLSWVVEEMENRFTTLVKRNFKSIEMYNFEAKRSAIEDESFKPLPYILVIIDELADLMMLSASEVEDSICRIAQMGRAVGIHLLISTQRPSVNVITGLIKANIPSRIAFMVTSNVDSRVILDCAGAEKLVGKGDMLYLPYYSNRPERVQGSFVTSNEIEMITGYIRNMSIPDYSIEISRRMSDDEVKTKDEDELFYEALRIVVDFGHASASLLQRRLRVGYSRAARIIDQMEDRGMVSGYDGSKPREVLISKEDLNKLLGE
ncbi:MAG: DNA translocase FtsK 4TM domain-containing protein [Candidatus Humimicrobiaceae bacterium]|jgi:S-DNA-T family DNA segregation ATPase FtsK/SpoIIIE|nr:DNA translocase FtsK 4TM domain-containing protein [Candidatus Humimicrobiaceae bacterium]